MTSAPARRGGVSTPASTVAPPRVAAVHTCKPRAPMQLLTSRRCVPVARRMLEEARRGPRDDRMTRKIADCEAITADVRTCRAWHGCLADCAQCSLSGTARSAVPLLHHDTPPCLVLRHNPWTSISAVNTCTMASEAVSDGDAALAASVQARMRRTRESQYPMIDVEQAVAAVLAAAKTRAPRTRTLPVSSAEVCSSVAMCIIACGLCACCL